MSKGRCQKAEGIMDSEWSIAVCPLPFADYNLYYDINYQDMKNYDSLVDALDDLQKRGFESQFEIETACLYCGDLDIRLYPEEFKVDEVYRFEGDSNPEDSVVLYAITASNGVKGTLVDGYGVYSDNLTFEMAKKLRYHPALAS